MAFSHASVAHNPLIATYLLKQDKQQWHLIIYTTLNTLHQSLLETHDKNVIINQSGTYNEALAFEYFKKNIQLTSNNKILELIPVVASISNHQSQFTFSVANGDVIAYEVQANITAMTGHLGQHNLFKIKVNNTLKRIMLSERNTFQGAVTVPK